ncbi:hypothetical protein K435DRAFT_56104 [Dendrothele bispora CBS 962.96]|uniref:Uncharacterized protein n=1 Tax=Dendrothele bispora (strain CBS 962.96) TaxID=1314807 RepID=A0A4V4HG70_DENBC|nr:hypothetical protein K435DRAFT_56104 [Dendrothele bispora CBS 962.96]
MQNLDTPSLLLTFREPHFHRHFKTEQVLALLQKTAPFSNLTLFRLRPPRIFRNTYNLCVERRLGMTPVPDFNIMVCGMATFAATVGYICSKRLVRRNSTFGSDSTVDHSSTFTPTTTTTTTTNTIFANKDTTPDSDPMLVEQPVSLSPVAGESASIVSSKKCPEILMMDSDSAIEKSSSSSYPSENDMACSPVNDVSLTHSAFHHHHHLVENKAEQSQSSVQPTQPTTTTTTLQEPIMSPNPQLQPVVVLPPVPVPSSGVPDRRRSLKRKQMHDHDENNNDLEYPYNLTAIYPNKRRTPPRDEEDSVTKANEKEKVNV